MNLKTYLTEREKIFKALEASTTNIHIGNTENNSSKKVGYIDIALIRDKFVSHTPPFNLPMCSINEHCHHCKLFYNLVELQF